MARIAVITGDLIGSTRAAQPAAFRKRLLGLLKLMSDKFDALTTLYRGDGFQIALGGNTNAFEVAVLLRTGLIAKSPNKKSRWDARAAIAFGRGQLSSSNQNSAAYINSGRTLDDIGKAHLKVYGDSDISRLAVGPATAFADDILNQLTPTEAEVLYYYFLEDSSHQQIAEKLGKQRPTVTVALQRAKYSLLEKYVEDMNDLVKLTHE